MNIVTNQLCQEAVRTVSVLVSALAFHAEHHWFESDQENIYSVLFCFLSFFFILFLFECMFLHLSVKEL